MTIFGRSIVRHGKGWNKINDSRPQRALPNPNQVSIAVCDCQSETDVLLVLAVRALIRSWHFLHCEDQPELGFCASPAKKDQLTLLEAVLKDRREWVRLPARGLHPHAAVSRHAFSTFIRVVLR